MENTKCNKPIKTQYIRDLPIDNLDSLPDYILSERDVLDEATGTTIGSIVRVPSAKLFPTASLDNIFALEKNNTALTVPENQVRACYVANETSSIVMKYADATHPAMFLALGEQAGMMLCQNCGVVNIPNGHAYVIGATYYTGANGEPTTDSASGQKLFIPVSSTKLLVKM